MSANDEILEILKDALGRAGSVRGRRMFGGVGVYFDGIFFAIIDDGAIYLKTSDETRLRFAAEGSRAFSYMTKNGRAELHSYWLLPERLLDDTEDLRDWASASVAAAKYAASETKRSVTPARTVRTAKPAKPNVKPTKR
ncbi:TfoX/Sxy family protein [Hyphomicrobium facile]|uniref:DNA transformation protein n=1 Tax=Hyphomicrobium facile TaxID=51670 RepID=A0A1I7N0L9_9HYPH|nr:TfoX/Sxy family protein [Hyphomicrobium facile]SFV28220.1 DNA transformation protein [Hyphomicrobium facile]